MLPYADSFYTDIAFEAVNGACFGYDVTDQFLTMVAMENMAEYDGDGDFGTLTTMELNDELRVVCTLLDLAGNPIGEYRSEGQVANTASHYARNAILVGEGGSQKWWSDWYPMSVKAAEKAQERFSEAYSLYLGCEDCGHGYEDDPCICGA